ncbi:pentapeptide repeat-containing protein [Dehalogenimonas sp. THU2]|uniref:pentapeptide repeat-containing protein n=1 Tax=Dehalogenimonas sp. THU2 TaxID=3151121 RepID=UPI00321815D5
MGFPKTAYYRETFTGLSLSNETITGREFDECEFIRCSFVDCKFESCKFLSCRLVECVISAIKPVNCRFREVKFLKSKVIGFDWTKAIVIEDLEFDGCQINYSNFRLLKLPGIKIIDCEAKEVDFIETDLTNGVFKKTDLENSQFFKTNLTGADFSSARNYSIDVRNNILKKTRFSMPEALALLDGLDIIIE